MKKANKKMGKLAMRVAVAKDVIKQIGKGSLEMHQGTYLNAEGLGDRIDDWTSKGLQKALKKTTCIVCAKGALFVAYVRRFNSIEPDELDNVSGNETLSGLFGALWETAEDIFEEGADAFPADDSRLDNLPDEVEDRALWLMKNIIASKGKSVLPLKGAKP